MGTHGARNHAGRARRRGAAYVFVLLTAMILSVIGLTALVTARIQTRVQSDGERIVRARFFAQSVVELALQRIDTNANWRTTYTNDAWTAGETYKGATISFKLVDETDGDLANDLSQSARLYARADIGGATRIYSVLIAVPNVSDLLANGDMELGTLGWQAWQTGAAQIQDNTGSGGPHSGVHYVRVKNRVSADSGIAQDATPKLTVGATYQVSLWLRMKDSAATARVTMTTNATGGTTETSFTQANVGTGWTLVRGALSPAWSGTLNTAYLRVGTASSTQDFFIDDAMMFSGSQPLPRTVITAGTWRQETADGS